MPNKKFILMISVSLVALFLLNGGVFANYLKYRQLFSELKNDCQTGGLLFYEDGVLTCNDVEETEDPSKDTTTTSGESVGEVKETRSSVVAWTTLASYPTGCSAGQAVQVIGDTLTCISIWDDVGDLPLASPSDGDGTHVSTADQIYDWVMGKGYISSDSNISKDDLDNNGSLDFDWSNAEVADDLTISGSGSITWSALTSYPTGCSAGQAVQVIGDTLTCISVGGGSSLWTDGGDTTYLTSVTDDLAVGGTDNTAPFYFDVGTSLLTLSGLSVNTTAVFNEAGGDSDFRVEGDTEDNLLRIDAGTDTVRMGDWDTNYATFAKDGELTFVGTARVIVDRYISASGVKAPGAKPATFVEAGLTAVWQFADAAAGNEQTISGTLKIPSQMDRTVAPIFKIGWSVDGVSPGNCEWQLEYLYIGPNDATNASAQGTLTSIDTASSTSNGLDIASFSGMDLPSATDQAMLFKITRLSAGANDTIVDTVELRGMLFTHTRDKLGIAL